MSERNIRTELRRLSRLYTYPVSHIMESGADRIADLERQLAEAQGALDAIEEYGTKEINAAVELRRQLAEARKDTERLDWLLHGDGWYDYDLVSRSVVPVYLRDRDDIDHAMKGQDDE